MGLKDVFVRLGESIGLCGKPSISLNAIESVGEKTLQKVTQVFGKEQKVMAEVKNYCQKVNVHSRGEVTPGAIKTRVYTPAPDTPLANIGVKEVGTTIYPSGGRQIQANVEINGQMRSLSHEQLKSYSRIMNRGTYLPL